MNIEARILNVLGRVRRSQIDLDKNICSLPLTGKEIGLSAVDFAYFVMELSEEFDICFSKEDFVNYKFNTINSIIEIVEEKLKV